MSDRPAATAPSVEQWAGMAGRLDFLGLRELEAQIRRDWSEDSLRPVLAAIAERRADLSQARDYPTCAYCGQPCDKPSGWFAVERWEMGRLVARGFACGGGCLLAVAHAQKPRDASSIPLTKGALRPVVEEGMIEPTPHRDAPETEAPRS